MNNKEQKYDDIYLNGKRYWYIITGEVRQQIKEISKEKTESSGYLLGARLKGTNELVIKKFTKPTKSDIRKKNSFIHFYQSWLEAIKEGDKHELMVIGHWHTHPPHLESSTPSEMDEKAFKDSMRWRAYFVEYIVHNKSEDVIVLERPKEEIVFHGRY